MDGPEHLRIGDAERDAVTSALHEHFAQGRLTRDELDERLSATLSAKTVGDLRPITHDLPDLSDKSGKSVAPSSGPPGIHTVAGPPGRRGPLRAFGGRPPIAPFLVVGGIVAAFSGFGVFRFLVPVLLIVVVLNAMHRFHYRHHHRHRHRHGHWDHHDHRDQSDHRGGPDQH
jgi:hypothetical protein